MFRFTFRDIAALFGVAALVVVIIVCGAAYLWWKNDPGTQMGRLRRGLEDVQQGTAKRDEQVLELTNP